MSLFSTLNVGASGLGAASAGLGVAGDNIANVGTTGFKESRATFADFMPRSVFGLAGQGRMGTGVAVSRVSTLFGQGSIDASDSALDMAIDGNGFFMVSSPTQTFYTRNGEFFVDKSGHVTTADGLRVQGYPAASGLLSPTVGDLTVSSATLPGIATSSVVVNASLSADTVPGADLAALQFYGTGGGGTSIAEAADAADFTTSMTVYDSLGVGHDVAVCFERASDGAWNWRALADASEVMDITGNPYSANAGEGFELASGTISFDTDGNPVASSQVSTADWNFRGASGQNVRFDFGVDALGVATAGSLRTSGNTSSVTSLVQDGRGAGELASVRVGPDGLVVGSYTNGEQQVLGQVAVATFEAEGGLVRMGGTLFASSVTSGEPAVGVAGTGGRGSLAGNALERSNVELEEQFVNMITHQRAFQANAKVVSMADEALQVLVNLV